MLVELDQYGGGYDNRGPPGGYGQHDDRHMKSEPY